MSETGKSSYKDTLNLPKTSFDMKANLLAKEPVILAKWKREDLYGQIRRAREGAERFILHDGPPYANGNIHIGTALNKVLKDMVVRIKTMEGFDSPYLPGWDCHGLPIEQKVMDELGAAGKTMPAMEIRRRCFAYAEKYAGVQSEQFQRLGVMGEFDRPYITMKPQYEAAVLEVFARLVEQGIVYRQLKPVHWSIENRTALADAELEYHDREDTSIYVALPLTNASAKRLVDVDSTRETVFLVVWTTTPWTLPANEAVAINPEIKYSTIYAEYRATPGGQPKFRWRFILAARNHHQFREKLKEVLPEPEWRLIPLEQSFPGRDLVQGPRFEYVHPLIPGKTCPVVPAEYVTVEDGTGLVHTAPGHGMEDYGTALKCGLKIDCPVQADGTFDDTAPKGLRRVSVWKANDMVIDHLKDNDREKDRLNDRAIDQLTPRWWNWASYQGPIPGTPPPMLAAKPETITHSYPHDWRSKTPTIFRATEQWFIAVDRKTAGGGPSLREMAMETCRRELSDGGVKFVPAWGRNRIAGMLESRPDWCISRQRVWGLPIPAFYNREGKALMTPATVRAVAKVIAKEGSDAWFRLSPAKFLADYDPERDRDFKDPEAFPFNGLTAGTDIFDVWFESGSSWFAVAIGLGLVEDIPVEMYLEGSDQHRGWFQLSLLPALGARGKAPFKTVLTHGFIVDEEGRKMSKSSGNFIAVMDQLEKRGADILRWWIASQNYQDDVRCSENLIAQAEDAYRKIRNTLRYCMGACCDFDPAHHSARPADHAIDLWMKMEVQRLIRDVRAAYDEYEFHRAARLLYEFCTVQASAVYFSAVKDRLYCDATDSPRRRATQTVIHEMLLALVKLLAPVLPHTCEEAWEHVPFRPAAEPHSVHLAALPECNAEMLQMAETLRPETTDLSAFEADEIRPGPMWVWDRLLDLRSAGLVKLEALRNSTVKNPLDAEAVFKVAADNDAAARFVETYLGELEDMLGVGYARMERGAELPEGVAVDVEVFDARGKYNRCARCWKRRPDVGSDPAYPDLSARDAAVMRGLKR